MSDASIASTTPVPASPGRLVRLAVEFGVLFGAVPVLLATDLINAPLIPVLLAFTAAIFVLLVRDSTFDRRCLWLGPGGWLRTRGEFRRILLWFAVLGGALSVLVVIFMPERWLSLPREKTTLWAIIMVAYPVFSVYPQEVVWRAFLHHRYRQLFSGRWSLIAASAVAFGVMHVVFENWIAVVLTLMGGVLFAHTYERSRSTLAVSVEHALYGCLVFTIGLGWFFYGGAVRG